MLVVLLTTRSDPRQAGPTVAYTYPADGGVQNVWIAPVADPTQAEQLTFTAYGIFDFGVSRDGDYLAYSERTEPTGLHEIMLMNLNTRQITQITACVAASADCHTPVFRPAGNALAYERVSVNNSAIGQGAGAARIWLADLTRQPYDNQPLSPDPQFIGSGPEWSLDGNSLALYSSDESNRGIMVYNFNPAGGDKTLRFVPSLYGVVGALSPDGTQLVYPDIYQSSSSNSYAFLRLADLNGLNFVNFTSADDSVDDIRAVWKPDGSAVTVVRRYTDERYTQGYQLYDVRVDDQSVTPLLVDPAYSHGFFSYDVSGTLIVLQRLPLVSSGATRTGPQVWTYNVATHDLTLIADSAFQPRWVYSASGDD